MRSPTLALLATTLALTATTAATAQAASLPAGTTAILTGAPSLQEALPTPVSYSAVTSSALSSDARYVAFASSSDGLSTQDDDRVTNVYVKDRQTGAVIYASRRTT